MKKFLILFAAFALTLTLTGCQDDTPEVTEIPDEVTMDNVDEFLSRSDVQYIDLRNFDDKMKSGYISGFEMIPFFDYLELEDILVRTDGDWTFAAADIKSQAGLRGLFDEDKTIFLMCGSGTRAGYVMAALESLGYENVYNVGGISNYAGDFMVDGDGSYQLNADVAGDFTPGTYYGIDPMSGYTAVVVVNAHGGISNVIFDAYYHGSTKNVLDADYTLGSGTTWKAEAEMLADYIISNQGWKDIVLDETDLTGLNALTVPHHFIDIDIDASPDAVAGVTIGAEGFVLAWNNAIAQASDSDLGVVVTTNTAADWAAAHAPAFTYVDGVYYGMDEPHGYYVKVTVEDGFIVDVFFDALYDVYKCEVDGVVDPTITRSSNCAVDSTYEWVLFAETTKQVLGEDYMLASDVTWAAEADELAAAIIEAQEWSAAWDIILGTDGGHDKFDPLDQDVIDAVAGVTIGIEGFKVAFEEAMEQAVPAS